MVSPAARAVANRLVLPESLRLLPLWVLGLLKSAALRGGAKVCWLPLLYALARAP